MTQHLNHSVHTGISILKVIFQQVKKSPILIGILPAWETDANLWSLPADPRGLTTVVVHRLHTWVFELLSHGTEGGHLLLLWGVDDHHCGTQDAQQATNLPMHVQPLIQEIGCKHSTGRK